MGGDQRAQQQIDLGVELAQLVGRDVQRVAGGVVGLSPGVRHPVAVGQVVAQQTLLERQRGRQHRGVAATLRRVGIDVGVDAEAGDGGAPGPLAAIV
jgi:hypothetical protein